MKFLNQDYSEKERGGILYRGSKHAFIKSMANIQSISAYQLRRVYFWRSMTGF